MRCFSVNFTEKVLPSFTLDEHAARLFLPAERTGPVHAHIDIVGPGFPPRTYRARLVRDYSGRQQVVLQREGSPAPGSPSFVLRSPRFLRPEDAGRSPERIVMELAAGVTCPRLFGNMQRVYVDEANGCALLLAARGAATLVDLRPGGWATGRFHRVAGETELAPEEFIDLPNTVFHGLAAGLLEDPTTDAARTWTFLRSSESDKCRESFSCSGETWECVRQVLGWALVCGNHLDALGRDGGALDCGVKWLYWLRDDAALQYGEGPLLPLTPFLRAWRDAVVRSYGCVLPRMTPRDFFVSSTDYASDAGAAEAGAVREYRGGRASGPLNAFKAWLVPTALRCTATDYANVLVTKRRLQAWAYVRLPASEWQSLLKMTR